MVTNSIDGEEEVVNGRDFSSRSASVIRDWITGGARNRVAGLAPLLFSDSAVATLFSAGAVVMTGRLGWVGVCCDLVCGVFEAGAIVTTGTLGFAGVCCV